MLRGDSAPRRLPLEPQLARLHRRRGPERRLPAPARQHRRRPGVAVTPAAAGRSEDAAAEAPAVGDRVPLRPLRETQTGPGQATDDTPRACAELPDGRSLAGRGVPRSRPRSRSAASATAACRRRPRDRHRPRRDRPDGRPASLKAPAPALVVAGRPDRRPPRGRSRDRRDLVLDPTAVDAGLEIRRRGRPARRRRRDRDLGSPRALPPRHPRLAFGGPSRSSPGTTSPRRPRPRPRGALQPSPARLPAGRVRAPLRPPALDRSPPGRRRLVLLAAGRLRARAGVGRVASRCAS